MKVRKIAIIGLGSIGRRHIKLVNEIYPNIEIILVRSGKGEFWPEEKIATNIVFSIEDAIEIGIQAAIISSPTVFHIEQAKQLVDRGIHLLVEKPLSNSMEGIREFEKLVSKNNSIVLVGYVLRFDPAAKKLKEWLGSLKIGKILHARIECGSYLPDWRPEQDYRKTVSASSKLGGGVLLELSHEIDYMHWFFGKPTSVYANLRNSGTLNIDVDDQADLVIRNNDGYILTIQLDFNRRHTTRFCSVQTTNGELVWNAIKKSVVWKPSKGDVVTNNFEFERDYIYTEQLKDFIISINNKSTPTVSIHDGIRVMELIDASITSNKTKQEVFL